MRRIGFIDLFLDEWHANHYPEWFRSAPKANDFTLGYAWEETTLEGRRPMAQWCAENGMTAASSIAEVVENSDAICVLAPANPEVHERLAELALCSGKPVYIDKPFAPDRATAERLFAKAKAHGTPLMSSSALRYGDQLLEASKQYFSKEKATFAATTGNGRSFDEYGIHQLEMIVSQLGIGAEGVQCTYNENGVQCYEIRYADGRRAQMTYHTAFPMAFSMSNANGGASSVNGGDMFQTLLAKMMDFFETGISPAPQEETIEIAALLEAALKSRASGQFERC